MASPILNPTSDSTAVSANDPRRQVEADTRPSASRSVASEPSTLLDRCEAIGIDAQTDAVAYLLRSDTSQGGE